MTNTNIIPAHPVFGRLEVVSSRSKLTKVDQAIVRTEFPEAGIVVDEAVGPATQHRNVICYITDLNGKALYYVHRDEVYRTSFQLRHPEGKPLPVKLQGRYTAPHKAVEAVVDYVG